MTSPTPDPPESAPVTVLLVDDEPSILRALRRILAGLPAELLTAADGAEALALMRQQRIDVLVADIDMPSLDGMSLVRAARRESPATWRILMTGAATMDRTIAAINDGEVIRFFEKPLDPRQFRDEMAALVKRVEQQRREGVDEARRARREALHAWVKDRFPGAEVVERDGDGAVRVELGRVAAAFARAGPAARRLVGK